MPWMPRQIRNEENNIWMAAGTIGAYKAPQLMADKRLF